MMNNISGINGVDTFLHVRVDERRVGVWEV